MSGPELSVTTDALKSEAELWRNQSAAMERISQDAASLRMDAVDVGVFLPLLDAANSVIDLLSQESHNGSLAMSKIDSALLFNCGKYERREAETAVSFKEGF